MNELMSKRNATAIDLSAALDRSVEAAVALGMSEKDFVSQATERMQIKAAGNIVNALVEPERKMYSPEAGP